MHSGERGVMFLQEREAVGTNELKIGLARTPERGES